MKIYFDDGGVAAWDGTEPEDEMTVAIKEAGKGDN